MAIEKLTIAIIWMGSIGLTAILSTLLLTSNSTKDWSEKRIVYVSGTISLLIVAMLILLT